MAGKDPSFGANTESKLSTKIIIKCLQHDLGEIPMEISNFL